MSCAQMNCNLTVKYGDFFVITWLVCLSQHCFTELQLLLSRLALTDSCSYYFIQFQSSVASTYHYVQCHGRASKGSLILSALWKGRFCARLATQFEYKGKFAIIQIEEGKNNSKNSQSWAAACVWRLFS